MKRFMVVDDSKVIRNQIERILGSSKYEFVGSAKNGVEAIQEFEKLRPEMVTMDLTMSEMNGIETIERMIAIAPSVRILVVSALSDKATALKALRLGAYGFLCKPFTTFDLNEAVDELMSEN